jgi:PAS domain S-box-containing protein
MKKASTRFPRILQNSEEKFRLLAENTSDMISLHALNNRLLYISPSCRHLLGFEPEELVGSNPLERVHPDDVRHILSKFRSGLMRGTPVHSFDVRLRHREGHYIWLEASIQPIMAGARAGQFVIVSRDISQRKKTDEALHISMAYNQALLRAIPDLLFVLDANGIFVDYRADSSHRLYAPPEVFIGKPVASILPPYVVEKVMPAIEMAILTGEIQEFEYDLAFPGEAEVYTYEVRLMSGGENRVIALVRDVSNRRQSEKALQITQTQLAQRVEELEQRSGQIALLTEISNMLQTSISLEEAYDVISQYGSQLFPDTSGMMMMSHSIRGLLQITSTWGGLDNLGQQYQRDDCWGIRRGRSFISQETSSGLQCVHISPERLREINSYLCVPIMAQGEAIGLLHLQYSRKGHSLSASHQQFAEAFTEQLGLALSNLQLREKLREQATHEPLTGLFNRYYMEESLERELSRAVRNNRPVAIIIMDLDHFKELNTEFGHPNVDQMLREFGGLLKNSVRGEDIACRYGGDEFLVIMRRYRHAPRRTASTPDVNARCARRRTRAANGYDLGGGSLLAFPRQQRGGGPAGSRPGAFSGERSWWKLCLDGAAGNTNRMIRPRA